MNLNRLIFAAVTAAYTKDKCGVVWSPYRSRRMAKLAGLKGGGTKRAQQLVRRLEERT